MNKDLWKDWVEQLVAIWNGFTRNWQQDSNRMRCTLFRPKRGSCFQKTIFCRRYISWCILCILCNLITRRNHSELFYSTADLSMRSQFLIIFHLSNNANFLKAILLMFSKALFCFDKESKVLFSTFNATCLHVINSTEQHSCNFSFCILG